MRYNFWNHLSNILSSLVNLFIIIGDFNDIDDISDRYDDLPPNIFRLSNFLNSLNLHNIPYRGPAYTWSNGQHHISHILQRLDKAMATFYWIHYFPNAFVKHLPRYRNDHAPIILFMHPHSTSFF